MRFKIWLEYIDREEAKSIVLNALGSDDQDHEEEGTILGSLIGSHAHLDKLLSSFSALNQYNQEIGQFIKKNKNKPVLMLVDFIANLRHSADGGMEHPTQNMDDPNQDLDTTL